MTDVLMGRLRVYLYITFAMAISDLAVSIIIAVLAYITNILLNPLVMLCIVVMVALSIAILIFTPKYFKSGNMPYIKFIWFLESLTLVVIFIVLEIVIPGGSSDVRFISLLCALLFTLATIGIASTEAPNWIYMLRKSKAKQL